MGDKYLGELLEAPFMVFARVVAGKVGGCDIRNCLGIDANNLCENQRMKYPEAGGTSYFPPPSFFWRYCLWSHGDDG